MTQPKKTTDIMSIVNNFVSQFLSSNKESLDSWVSPDNQLALKNIFSGVSTKSVVRKDKNRPKKLSAYLLFCNENRESAKKSLLPGSKNTDVTTELGRMWVSLKQDPTKIGELERLNKLAEDCKLHFDTEMKTYTPLDTSDKSSKKKKRDPSEPKKGKSSYLFFCDDNRDEVKKRLGDTTKNTEITIELGKMWNLLKADPSKKAKALLVKYEKLADNAKVEYIERKKSYEDSKKTIVVLKDVAEKPKKDVDEKPKKDVAEKPKKDVAEKPKKDVAEKPKKDVAEKPKTSGYLLFMKTRRLEMKDNKLIKPSDLTSILSKDWKDLDDDEKKTWTDKASSS